MIPSETVVEGTLKPDGTLELDQKPNLPPGRVKVVLRQDPGPQPTLEGWWEFMTRSRQELESSGAGFLDESAVEAHIEWLRESDPTDEQLARPEPS
jgi:hypothetical protein